MTDAERLLRLAASSRPPSSPGPSRRVTAARAPAPPAPAVIAVCSGKGGVGKSTVALNLAVALAAGSRVGLIDADVHAPDIPLMVGLRRSAPATGWMLARPGGLDRTPLEPIERYGIQIMSSGFIVAEDQAVAWTADLVSLLLNQLIWSTRWGPLDFLVIDLPPGTSDLVQETFRLLPTAGAVVVVTPQDVAHLDTRRVLTVLRTAGVRIIGGVENMSGLRCPCCDMQLEVFSRVAPERSIWVGGLSHLGAVPLAVVGSGGDDNIEPVVLTAAGSARGKALHAVATAVAKAVRGPDQPRA